MAASAILLFIQLWAQCLIGVGDFQLTRLRGSVSSGLQALLSSRFLTSLLRLPLASAGLPGRLVLVCTRHPLVSVDQDQTKRQASAMFALESRFPVVPSAALLCRFWSGLFRCGNICEAAP